MLTMLELKFKIKKQSEVEGGKSEKGFREIPGGGHNIYKNKQLRMSVVHSEN